MKISLFIYSLQPRKIIFILFLFIIKIGHSQTNSILDSLLQARKSYNKEDSIRVKLLIDISKRTREDDPQKALEFADEAITLAQKIAFKKGLANSFTAKANSYYYLAKYREALEYYEQASSIYSELNDKINIASIKTNIGNIYFSFTDYPKALEYYQKSILLYRELNKNSGIGSNLCNMGNVYQSMEEYDKALDCYKKGLSIFEIEGDKSRIVMAINNIGLIYANQSDYMKAMEYYQKALGLNESTGNKRGIAMCYNNMGIAYKGLSDSACNMMGLTQAGKYSKALEYLQKAFVLNEEMEDSTSMAAALIEIGQVYYSLKNYPKAFEYSYQGKILAHNSGALEFERNVLQNLAFMYENTGKYDSALSYYKQYYVLYDSIMNDEKKMDVRTKEIKFEFDKKETEMKLEQTLADEKVKRNLLQRNFSIAGIGLLLMVVFFIYRNLNLKKKTNFELNVLNEKVSDKNEELSNTLQDLKETQAQLIKIEKQKEAEILRSQISQDIHDDISSGLTKISWMSEQVKARAKKPGNSDTGVLLDKIVLSSRETIAKLGEIIWAVNPEQDSFENFLSYQRNYILNFLDDTSFKIAIDFPDEVPKVILNPELKRNLFLVMKEALNNCVKYSEAENINVVFKFEKNNYLFSIADNGIGIEEKELRGSGNGMTNMRRRMESIKGKFMIESEKNAGTKIILEGVIY